MIPHLSVSQLKLHKLSPLKWCYQYIEGIKEPTTEALRFGKDVADCFDCALNGLALNRTDVNPLAADIVRTWVEYNVHELTMNEWTIEEGFLIKLREDLPPFRGFIDMLCRDTKEGIPHILDHKTCTENLDSGKFWGLSSSDLLKDWQLCLYTHYVLEGKYPDDDTVVARLSHNQLCKQTSKRVIKRIKFRSVTNMISGKQLTTVINEIIEEAENIVKTHEAYTKGGKEAVAKLYDEEKPFRLCDKCKYSYGRPCMFWGHCQGKKELKDL